MAGCPRLCWSYREEVASVLSVLSKEKRNPLDFCSKIAMERMKEVKET